MSIKSINHKLDSSIEFELNRLLWIASKQTLLVSNIDVNAGEMCALHVTEGEVTSQTVTLDGVQDIVVRSWSVLRDKTGGGSEHALALFDATTRSVVMKCDVEAAAAIASRQQCAAGWAN